MKKFVCFVLSLFLIGNVFAQNESSKAANRRTSLRYLQLAKQYVSDGNWNSVVKSCAAGLEYDDTVADLYYLEALGLINLGNTRFDVLPVIAKALDEKNVEWVDYNQSNARVFYADLLSCTGKPEEAIAVLDKSPLVYSSDAEYVRIKSYYEINTPESIAKAEEKIDTIRRVYPNDARFFYLFFGYEYNLLYKENETKTGFEKQALNPVVKKICDSFISHVPDYDNGYDDLEIYASIFADGENQKRLLKAFDARGFKNVLYPIAALEAKVMTEEEAVDYFLTFIDGELDAKILFQFYSMIKDENLKQYMDEHLNAFKGTLVYDTNNNLEANLKVKYERGRAASIIFDKDNDSNLEWEIECDFGAPKEAVVYDQNAIIQYGTYPNVTAILFKDLHPGVSGITIYNINDESFEGKLFEITKTSFVSAADFYVVNEKSIINTKDLFVAEKIIDSTNTVTEPTLETEGGYIVFAMPSHTAEYFDKNGKCYANATFLQTRNSVIRNVDKDGDGLFETTEVYNFDDKQGGPERDQLAINIWGSPAINYNIFISEIRMDTNADTRIDFYESYSENGEKMSIWDTDFDDNVDTIYRRLAEKQKFKSDGSKTKVLLEENSYYVNNPVKVSGNEKYWITVVTERNGSSEVVPKFIIENSLFVDYDFAADYFSVEDEILARPFEITLNKKADKIPVVKGTAKNFYWLGQKENEKYEKADFNDLIQGHVIQDNFDDCYVRYILIGSNIYAKKIEKINEVNNTSDSENSETLDAESGDNK